MSPIRVLLAEDSADDAELVMQELKDAGLTCTWTRVDSAPAFGAALARETWDIILSDFNMPSFTASTALQMLKATGKDIPFVIISGSVGEAVAVAAMKAGANDFFVKGSLARLPAAVERELREAQNRHEKHQALSELQEAQERYRLIIENARDYAIFMLDAAGNVTSWNPGAERLLGYRDSEIIGSPFANFFTETERARGEPEEALRTAREDGSHLAEGRRLRRDGSEFWALCAIDRIPAEGDVLGFSGIFRDTTERRRLFDDLQQAVRARDEFLSIASHELKTPLTSLQLQLSRLERLRQADVSPRLSDEKVGKMLTTVQRQTERLTQLVNTLLDVTRVASERIELDREELDLTALVEAVLLAQRPAMERAGCVLSLTASPGVVGAWDRARIQTVVSNLLANAIKYGPGKPIEVIVDRRENAALLQVKDHGIGIPEREQARIFQRFERAVPEEHYGGFGLGLWLARQIVDAHGGTIRFESAPGKGSAFTVELPLGQIESSPQLAPPSIH